MLSGPTMRECLLADSSPVPYPLPRPPIAPLCVCAAPMRLCMSLCPLVIPVDGPTAWLRSTWMASSKRSRRSSMRLCCGTRDTDERWKPAVFEGNRTPCQRPSIFTFFLQIYPMQSSKETATLFISKAWFFFCVKNYIVDVFGLRAIFKMTKSKMIYQQ